MQSSDLRRNLLQEVVQDHGRGLTEKYTMANGVKEKSDLNLGSYLTRHQSNLTPLNKLD